MRSPGIAPFPEGILRSAGTLASLQPFGKGGLQILFCSWIGYMIGNLPTMSRGTALASSSLAVGSGFIFLRPKLRQYCVQSTNCFLLCVKYLFSQSTVVGKGQSWQSHVSFWMGFLYGRVQDQTLWRPLRQHVGCYCQRAPLQREEAPVSARGTA